MQMQREKTMVEWELATSIRDPEQMTFESATTNGQARLSG